MIVLWIIPAYLIVGAICTGLMDWKVQPGCPFLVIAWSVSCAVVVTPYVCVRHRIGPWRLSMHLERTR